MQLEHGEFLSHLILRCWHRTQASILGCLGVPGEAFDDMSKFAPVISHVTSGENVGC